MKYLDTKENSIEDSVTRVLMGEKKLDPVNPTAVKKKFDDRKDKDIDNDGDVDSTDKYLHKRRKAISKAIKGDEKNNVRENVKDIHDRKPIISIALSLPEINKEISIPYVGNNIFYAEEQRANND